MHRNIINIILVVLLILSIYLNVRYSIIIVDGISMEPTYHNRDFLIYDKNIQNIKKNDIVIFKYNKQSYVKRVHGLPGDTISYNNGNIYINGIAYLGLKCEKCTNKEFKLEEDQYYVLGDNTYISKDSRIMGNIDLKTIYGKISYE